ncbi:type III-B CRISPR module RAMP protein Cmr6 [bacterium]|nr:type III-B CRISPR module RAMP protein Cmr6 [bacterium]
MTAARYSIEELKRQHAGLQLDHAGLLLHKYLASRDDPGKKDDLIDDAKQAAGISSRSDCYKQGFDRWLKSLHAVYPTTDHFNEFEIVSKDRLLIGVGSASPLEVGLSLHHTYGLPYLPATALKGLASHYAHSVWGEKDQNWRMADKGNPQGNHHRFVFGSTSEAGCIDFHDGWLEPGSKCILVEDVMTPHHSSYYGAAEDDDNHPPADWDSPIPIQYLTANKKLKFRFFLGCALHAGDEQQRKCIKAWLDIVQALLDAALKEWGLGAKTSSGYGVMRTDAAAS